MIKLTKGPAPDWLHENRTEMTQKYLSAPKGSKPSVWNRNDLKSALDRESWGKCMYCEVISADGAYPAIEHIRPREEFPDLVLQWENLGWACTRCNTNKSSYWSDHKDLQLLNPYVDEPDDHIEHAGPLVVGRLDSQRGQNTVRRLKLNREVLFTEKAKRLQDMDARLQAWSNEPDGEKRSVREDDIRDLLTCEAEYSASLRAFALLRGFPI